MVLSLLLLATAVFGQCKVEENEGTSGMGLNPMCNWKGTCQGGRRPRCVCCDPSQEGNFCEGMEEFKYTGNTCSTATFYYGVSLYLHLEADDTVTCDGHSMAFEENKVTVKNGKKLDDMLGAILSKMGYTGVITSDGCATCNEEHPCDLFHEHEEEGIAVKFITEFNSYYDPSCVSGTLDKPIDCAANTDMGMSAHDAWMKVGAEQSTAAIEKMNKKLPGDMIVGTWLYVEHSSQRENFLGKPPTGTGAGSGTGGMKEMCQNVDSSECDTTCKASWGCCAAEKVMYDKEFNAYCCKGAMNMNDGNPTCDAERDCSEIKDPCMCTGECGWSATNNACQKGSTTGCDECSTVDAGCKSTTCQDRGCPAEYDPMAVCQCNVECEKYGNCCDDAATCTESDACDTYSTCDDCLADLDCVFNKRTKECVYGQTAPMSSEIEFTSCPAPTDSCASYSSCDDCLADMTCVYNKLTKKCLFGETAPMVSGITFECPAPADPCASYSSCDDCLADMTCVYNKANGKCLFGETAPFSSDIVFECPAPTDSCASYSSCDECLADMTCVYNKKDMKCLFGETAPFSSDIVFDCPDPRSGKKDCSAIDRPCMCDDGCGWSTSDDNCQPASESKTTCDECSTMPGCDTSTCQESGCPMEYDPMRVCQCTEDCEDYGNCCGDVRTCRIEGYKMLEQMKCKTKMTKTTKKGKKVISAKFEKAIAECNKKKKCAGIVGDCYGDDKFALCKKSKTFTKPDNSMEYGCVFKKQKKKKNKNKD